MKCFLDSAVVIYYVEQSPTFGPLAIAKLAALIKLNHELVVSDLVRMECLVGPLRARDSQLLAAYHAFFHSSPVRVVPVTPLVCDDAASIRANFGFKPLDSLHLAAAIANGCTSFLTNDQKLAQFSKLTVELLA